ncbi:MAG: type II secretion system F family protein [Thermogutta sp.]|jgi:general secretion pathway protein F
MRPGARFDGSPVDWERLADVISQSVRSDLPLPNALEALAEDCPDRATKSAFRQLATLISRGMSLQDGLRRISNAQSRELRAILEAGTLCPQPGEALSRLLKLRSHYQESLFDLRAVLGYPILCGLVIMAGLPILLSQWLTSGFSLINLANYPDIWSVSAPDCSSTSSAEIVVQVSVWWLASLLFLVFIVLATAVLLVIAVGPTRLSSASWIYRMPLVGTYYRMAALSYLAGVMAELLDQGVRMPAALSAAARVSRWPKLKKALEEASRGTEEGIPLGEAMAKSPWMSATFLAFLADSSQTIPLEERFRALCSLFDRQVSSLRAVLERNLTGIMLLGLIPALMPLFAWFVAVQSCLATFTW